LVIQKRTRKQLRQSIGYNLNAIRTGTAYDAGSTTTLISLTLVGGDDNYNGKWLVVSDTSNSDNTESRIISDYTASAYRLTLQQALSFATAAGDTYEIWDSNYRPDVIHEFINQAIIDVTGQVYDPQESLSLHSDGYNSRFDLPSDFTMVNKIQIRDKMQHKSIHPCDAAFDETVDSDITVSLDTKDRKQGSSNRFDIVVGATGGEIATDSISSIDISRYNYLEFWIKSTGATTAGGLQILLDDSASCASPTVNGEVLDVPALSADTWTFCRVALSNPEDDTAIISVGLKYTTDIGKVSVWLDDIRAVANDTITWETVPNNLWHIDKEARQIVFNTDGVSFMGYKLLKITGGDKPALLSSDTSTCEIDDGYVINRATALALSANSGGPATDPDANRQQAAFYYGMSEQAKRAFPMLINVRTAS
jgi:hypothetical protein